MLYIMKADESIGPRHLPLRLQRSCMATVSNHSVSLQINIIKKCTYPYSTIGRSFSGANKHMTKRIPSNSARWIIIS